MVNTFRKTIGIASKCGIRMTEGEVKTSYKINSPIPQSVIPLKLLNIPLKRCNTNFVFIT